MWLTIWRHLFLCTIICSFQLFLKDLFSEKNCIIKKVLVVLGDKTSVKNGPFIKSLSESHKNVLNKHKIKLRKFQGYGYLPKTTEMGENNLSLEFHFKFLRKKCVPFSLIYIILPALLNVMATQGLTNLLFVHKFTWYILPCFLYEKSKRKKEKQ